MTSNLYLSPADLAEAMGLSVSTLKRWSDKGILNVERTAGGHRRIAVTEALRFVRESGLKPVLPHRLGLGEVGANENPADRESRFGRMLFEGRSEDARRLLVAAFVSGEDITRIADSWIRPAFEQVGELWKQGPEGIVTEHQATECVSRAISEMRALVAVDPQAPRAIGCAVGGDPYTIPTSLAALVLSVHGFEATNLGANLPLEALLAAAESTRPRLTWLSVSATGLEEGRRNALEGAASRLVELGSAVVIGGRSAPDRVAGATVCRDLSGLAAFAQGLRV